MDFLKLSKTRFTAKKFDTKKKISKADMDKLKEILRLSPSSINSQPWFFIIGSSDAAKAKIRPALADFNWPRLDTCSHFVLITVRNGLDKKFVKKLIDKEIADGRWTDDEAIKAAYDSRTYFIGLRDSVGMTETWEEKQAYIAMTTLMYGASSMGIDSTPIEGMDVKAMDKLLQLRNYGLHTVLLVTLGYDAKDDNNRTRPKSRFATEDLFSEMK